MAELVPVVAGTIVRASVRDVDAAQWDRPDMRKQAVKIWLDAQRSEHTKAAYRRDIAKWFRWCDEADVPVADARRADVDLWRNELTADSESPATIARRLSSVSSFYDYWLTEDIVARNPAKRAKRPKVSIEPVSIALTRRQAADLLAYVNSTSDQRTGIIVRLLAQTGMRVSELCNARAEDLGMSGGHHTLTITRKGGERQALPIGGDTCERIMDYLDGRTAGWILEVRRTERRGAGNDGCMDRSYVRVLLRRISREAGLPPEVCERMHPHVMRHSAATLLAADNVPPHEIQQMLGHADLRTTQRYIHHAKSLDASPVYRLTQLLAE